jgi:hypothetical protein
MNPVLDLTSIDRSEAKKILAVASAGSTAKERYDKISDFAPNPSQLRLYENTNRYDEILCSWANRTGKTYAVGALLYFHASGRYPDWWPGKRFDRPVRIIIMGITRTSLRESAQRILFDEYQTGEMGTGVIPKHIIDQCDIKWSKDDNNCVDFMRVPHVSGGKSYLYFTTQQVDWRSQMGTEFDVCWADEQLEGVGNPPKHYSQFLRATATNLDNRLIILTATPENGRMPIFDYFEKSESNQARRTVHYATLYDAHYSAERADRIRDTYPSTEWDYRVYGRPRMGSGRVYDFIRELLFCEPFEVPKHWRRIAGIDFGRKISKTAVTWIAQDPASGIYYFYDTDWMREADPKDIAPMIHKRDAMAGFKIPVAWPKDGLNSEASTGNQIARVYADLGVRMLGESAMMVARDGKKSMSVEAGVAWIQGLMDAGLLKIFDTPDNQVFLDELGSYHRDENNQIKKTIAHDPHHLDSARYGLVMFERFAYAPGRFHGGQKVPMVIGMQKGIFHGN